VTFTEMWLATVGSRAGVSPEALDAAEARLGRHFPADYRQVMARAEGGESEFGESWLVLDTVESMLSRNENQELMQFFPDITFFGGDGGGEAYAWDWHARRGGVYIVTPMIGKVDDDSIACGDTFEEFLALLHAGIRFDRTHS
jgi:SMI1 / KNR4 family (SUKH-1)